MEFNNRVVAFLGQLGYTDETPDSIAATCKGNLKRVWDFLLNHAQPRAEKQRIDRVVQEHLDKQEIDSAKASRTAQAAALRSQLRDLRRECDQMERTLAQQQEELRLQARAAVDEAGENQLARQERQDAELMILALSCFSQRCTHLGRLVAERHEALRADASRACSRQQQPLHGPTANAAAAGTRAPATAAQMLEELQQLVDAVRGEMQQALDAREGEISDPVAATSAPYDEALGLHLTGGAGGPQQQPSQRIVAGHAPSPALADHLRQLQLRPPAALLMCARALADRSVSQLASILAKGDAAAAAANAAVAQMPREVQERRALMAWTVSPADAALAEDDGGCGGDALRDGSQSQQQPCDAGKASADDLIRRRQQEHVQMFLSVRAAGKAAAAAQARLEALLGRPELAALQASVDGANAAAALWLSVHSKRAQVAALQSLQSRLLLELRQRQESEAALQDKWARIAEYMNDYQRQAALLCYLSEDSVALSSELAMQARAAAATLSGALAPGCRAAAGAAHGASGGAAREAGAGVRLPAAALAPGAPAKVLAAPTLARLRLAAQHLARAGGSASGAATPSGKLGVAGADAAPVGSRSGALTSAYDPAMAAALEGATALDDLAAIKCPTAIMAAVQEGCNRLRDQQHLLSALELQLCAGADRLSEGRAAGARLRAQAGAVRAADESRRLPRLEKATAEGRRAKDFADGAVKGALTDWWQQPAQHLTPWVTYEGRSCSEWLMEVQALHGRQRELSGT